ncbi:MAG: polyprenyl synthetase family protein [Bryobacterales bacterium]|nr:polyprenyl synthetase family protein [Bryobacterales bacterium]
MAPIVVQPERVAVERELELLLAATPGGDCGDVQEAMCYAALGAGKRIRPVLSLRVAAMLSNMTPMVLRTAAAVELFHCASLVIDDLPCMDNEMERRGKPTVHVRFGEANAVLAAFGLVALACRSVLELPTKQGALPQLVEFQKNLLKTLDCAGLIAGQARDLTLNGSDGISTRAAVNEMKTVPLFEMAAEAGMAGAELSGEDRQRIRLFGQEFGRAFQLADDVLDGDLEHRQPFFSHIDAARDLVGGFAEGRHRILELLDYLHAYAEQTDPRHR